MADLGAQRDAARTAFESTFGAAPTVAAYAPGRVNLIGDHTDYTGGFVLPMTIDRGTWALVRPRADGRVRAFAEAFGQAAWALDEPVAPSRPLWERYVFGTAREVAARAAAAGGADVYVTGDVPIGAGLSSSASLTVAVALGLAEGWGVTLSETEMALLAQRVEHVDAGVNCGIMDQVAVRSGRAGSAVLLDCRSLDHEPVSLPEGVSVVIVNSGVGRSLADSAYNARRAAVEAAAETLQAEGATGPSGEPIQSLRDITPEALAAHADALGGHLPFARHVVSENARVRAAARALRSGDGHAAGQLMAASHASLRDDYAVSGPELDVLVEEATALGALGARLTGAGFGGCTVNLVPDGEVEAFRSALADRYRLRTGLDAEVFAVRQNHEAHVDPLRS